MKTSIRSIGRRFFVPGLVLAAWTLMLWTTRVANALDDDSLVGWSRTWQVGVAVVFVAIAVALAGLSLLRPAAAARLGVVLAIAGSIWWIVRGVGIVIKDYEPAFTIVHVVLAIGTVAVSGWLLRGQRTATQSVGSTSEPSPTGFNAASKSG